MKKWISLACVAALLIAMLPGYSLPAAAEETSGKCGDNLTWELKDLKLIISGTGPMYDYPDFESTPWCSGIARLTGIVLEDGVTTIGDYAFADCYLSYPITIPDSVISIGSKIFSKNTYCNTYLFFLGEPPVIAEDAFAGAGPMAIWTILDWPEEAKRNYGGTVYWRETTLKLETSKSKQLVPLNYVFQPDDFAFQVINPTIMEPSYVPKNISISEYDNSTYGEKNVTVTADGYSFDFTYYVTDGSNHLDLINVEFPVLPTYDGGFNLSNTDIKPVFTVNGKEIGLSWKHNEKPDVGFGSITVTGNGVWEGFSKTFYYPILKADMSEHKFYTSNTFFSGMPITGNSEVELPKHTYNLTEGTDYEILYENSINPGQASAWAVGINNVYGHKESSFNIKCGDQRVVLLGNKIGKADGELSDDIAINQKIVSPGKINASINLSNTHVVSYALYRLDGDEFTLIMETTKNSWEEDSNLIYDFSPIYEGSMDKGGEVYVLSYSWIRENLDVYAGMTYLIIPAKVPDATSMTMYKVEGDGDFRNDYFGVTGDDGALGDITWTSSDPSVASVGDGIVALNKPGTATITAQWGNLTQSQTISVDLLDLTEGIIFDYHEETGARVIWDNRIMEEGIDYTLSVEKNGDAVTVTATGCGLFTGELMKEFVNLDSLANPHTHGFTNSCDSTCNSCDFTRDRDHTFSTEWSKDLENHYHECTVCGEQNDITKHTLTENGKECTVCGRLWTPGDIDGNGLVNRDDVIALLLHVSMPAAFPISILADYTGDDQITRDDVIQLLLHVSMPNAFPLQ